MRWGQLGRANEQKKDDKRSRIIAKCSTAAGAYPRERRIAGLPVDNDQNRGAALLWSMGMGGRGSQKADGAMLLQSRKRSGPYLDPAVASTYIPTGLTIAHSFPGIWEARDLPWQVVFCQSATRY